MSAGAKPGCFSRNGLTKFGIKSSFSARALMTFSSSLTTTLSSVTSTISFLEMVSSGSINALIGGRLTMICWMM